MFFFLPCLQTNFLVNIIFLVFIELKIILSKIKKSILFLIFKNYSFEIIIQIAKIIVFST